MMLSLSMIAGSTLPALATDPPLEHLAEMSVEQLLNIKVTSVARRAETLAQSPAAITALTQEDIRRSGATSIPELLRLVPGLNVAKLESHVWAVSSRGFNDVYANKLLVLIDGRSVYTPLFSGVFWEVQDTMLEDIDRVEVIRGPGATLWGANAVNGVINIITKKAADTQGLLFSATAGTEDRAIGAFRFGGRISDQLHYRVYGKWLSRDNGSPVDGNEAIDEWEMARGGFRVDWSAPGGNFLTLQGDLYSGRLDELHRRLNPASPFTTYLDHSRDRVSGGNLLARWTHTFSDTSELSLQTYYDHTRHDSAIVDETRDTFDVDFQHRFALGGRQTIVWGAGYRVTGDEVRDTFDLDLEPNRRTTDLFSAFLQDEISVVDKRLTLTLGSKFEHNDYTGFEVQPSARLLWIPAERHTVWASVARAVRTPSRAEDDITLRQEPVYPRGALFPGLGPIPPSPAAVTSVSGDRDFQSEKLIAYEAGYRVQLHDALSLDLAAFYNDYSELRSIEPGNPTVDFFSSPPAVRGVAGNKLGGETYGGELTINYQALPWWRLRGGYSLLFANLHRIDGGQDRSSETQIEGSSPQNQFLLRSSMDLTRNLEFDATLRYVDSLPSLNVDSYVAVDLRLGWRPKENVEFSIVAQNLFADQHQEFSPTTVATGTTGVETSVYGKITIRF
jgi:iron complex outermembrane recepter protein